MKLTVFFTIDKQFVSVDLSDFCHPKLNPSSISWKTPEWELFNKEETRKGICLYDGDWYEDTYLVQVVNDDQAESSVVFLRRVRSEKHAKIENLIKVIPFYTCETRRLAFPPIKSINTESASSDANEVDGPTKSKKRPLADLPPFQYPPTPGSKGVNKKPRLDDSFSQTANENDSPSASYTIPKSVISTPKTARDQVISTQNTPRDQVVSTQNTPRENLMQGIEEICQHLCRSITDSGRQLNSPEASLYMNAHLINELGKLVTAIQGIDRRLSRLEAVVAGYNNAQGPVNTPQMTLPIYNTIADLARPLPRNLIVWMKREGGADVKEHVRRVLDKVMCPEIQKGCNRKGCFGKAKFPPNLEAVIVESVQFLYPEVTVKDIEEAIRKYLYGAKDRHGGREERRKKKQAVPTEPPSSESDVEDADA